MSSALEILTIPALSDNYIYLLVDRKAAQAVAIDPGEASPLLKVLEEESLELTTVLCTHHHSDHIGGISGLKSLGAEIVASEYDQARVPGCRRKVRDGENLTLLNTEIQVLNVPGHTLGAVTYWIPSLAAAFTGDTLFNAGCGRLFEGTPEMMWESLKRLRALPEETRIFSGHEYTENNLRFARSLEPANEDVEKRYETVRQKRIRGEVTVGAPLQLEKLTNPFLRADDDRMALAIGLAEAPPLTVFTKLRRLKDVA